MLIRELFRADVTRNIPPVVYFHEQSPEKLAAEVSEYIVTGGWPENHPHRHRVPVGVHEAYVRLLDGIAAELGAPGGVGLPNVWVSGFYGSGKSSFAKLLGLALDGASLPDGRSLAQVLLDRDTSPRKAELRRAWDGLVQKIEPLAVVFDVGHAARDDEHVHAVAVRQVQAKLGYSSKSHHIAFAELNIEREKRWGDLQRASQTLFQKPWEALKDTNLAADRFSRLMAHLYPDIYQDNRDWHMRHTGTGALSLSVQEALNDIADMLAFRKPRATLFLVVDEVSQYVLAHNDRVERLRAFAEGLGAHLKGKVWLFALGQQQLDAAAEDSFLVKTKDRFPHHLRVHLAPTNIRDVVHRRLLHKRDEVVPALRDLFERHRAALKLYAYKCEDITADDFIEAYPLLPSQLELILDLTTALRSRSKRAQGDAQAIRGLLQLLGELFRAQRLVDAPVGRLIGIDLIYEVQQSALDADQQSSMARLLDKCKDGDELTIRAAKAVALLELVQHDTNPTSAKLVAQCLYDRVDLGDNLAAVTDALEGLRQRNLLGYSEKTGYKLQSQAGEEWERERRDVGVSREAVCAYVQETLKVSMAGPKRPALGLRSFPWAAVFSDAHRAQDVSLLDPREEAVVRVDFRFLPREEREEAAWIRKSAESALAQRLVWVAADAEAVEEVGRELGRSEHMVKLYKPRRESLSAAQKMLLQGEENRAEDLREALRKAVEGAWTQGRMYFRGEVLPQTHAGGGFSTALLHSAQSLLPKLYPYFKDISILPSELEQLLAPTLSGPSPKFLSGDLGILELDAGHYVPSCSGAIPKAVQAYIEQQGGVGGAGLLAHFSGPPYAYRPEAVMACVVGLLRASKLRIQPEGSTEITSIRDAGVKDTLTKERDFRRASFFAAQSEVSPQTLARLCKFFEEIFKAKLQREETAVADAVASHFPRLAQRLREVRDRLASLPKPPPLPDALLKLGPLLDDAISRCRQTRPTVLLLKQHLDPLREGALKLQIYDAELTQEALAAVRDAHKALVTHAAQLQALGLTATDLQDAIARLERHLASERPWVEVAALDPDLKAIREAYCAERGRLLVRQGEAADALRASLRQRAGFSLLSADQSHEVLRHIAAALDTSSPDSTSPSLLDLKDPFVLRLQRAEREAHATLDALMEDKDKDKRAFVRVELQAQNREISSEAELDAFLAELRHRLLEPLKANKRVRLG